MMVLKKLKSLICDALLRVTRRQYVMIVEGWRDKRQVRDWIARERSRLLRLLTPDNAAVVEAFLGVVEAINRSPFRLRNGSCVVIPARVAPSRRPETAFAYNLFRQTGGEADAFDFYRRRIQAFPFLLNEETDSKLTTYGGLRLLGLREGDWNSRLKGGYVIDGGAWVGDTALIYQTTAADRVYAFEPGAENHRLLSEVCAPFAKIVPLRIGLGDTTGQVTFTASGNHGKMDGTGAETIEVTTIDDFAVRHPQERCALIKLDVEGLESRVLSGALETIKRDRPLLLISLYHTPEDFFLIPQRIQALNLGYEFSIRPGHADSVMAEFVLAASAAPNVRVERVAKGMR